MLTRDNAVLVLIDVQGKLAQLMDDREALFDNLRKAIAGARAIGIPVLWNEQNPEKLGRTIPELDELLSEQNRPLLKMCFSCCGNPAFLEALESTGRRQVILVGIETHVCVYQTARDLLDRGFHVEVVADAASSRSAENKRVALERMAQHGAEITSTEMFLFELLGTAEAPEFREVQRIIKAAERPAGFVKTG